MGPRDPSSYRPGKLRQAVEGGLADRPPSEGALPPRAGGSESDSPARASRGPRRSPARRPRPSPRPRRPGAALSASAPGGVCIQRRPRAAPAVSSGPRAAVGPGRAPQSPAGGGRGRGRGAERGRRGPGRAAGPPDGRPRTALCPRGLSREVVPGGGAGEAGTAAAVRWTGSSSGLQG